MGDYQIAALGRGCSLGVRHVLFRLSFWASISRWCWGPFGLKTQAATASHNRQSWSAVEMGTNHQFCSWCWFVYLLSSPASFGSLNWWFMHISSLHALIIWPTIGQPLCPYSFLKAILVPPPQQTHCTWFRKLRRAVPSQYLDGRKPQNGRDVWVFLKPWRVIFSSLHRQSEG